MDDLNRTAADEAADIEKAKRPMMTVTCSLPQGIVLNNHIGKDGKSTSAANFGPGRPVAVQGSTDVDKEFWDAWAEHNGELIDRGVVSAVDKREMIENRDGEEDVGPEGQGGSEPDLDEAR